MPSYINLLIISLGCKSQKWARSTRFLKSLYFQLGGWRLRGLRVRLESGLGRDESVLHGILDKKIKGGAEWYPPAVKAGGSQGRCGDFMFGM